MSDLTATNCGCNNNSCSNNNNCSNGIFGNSCIWIILLLLDAVSALGVESGFCSCPASVAVATTAVEIAVADLPDFLHTYDRSSRGADLPYPE